MFLSVLACLMDKNIRFQNIPSITWPVLFLTAVFVVAAKLKGGIGLGSFGAEPYGGKKFFFVLASIIGYYALSSRRIPVGKASRYAGLFFLSGLTAVIANLIYFAGPTFYFLYLFFPVENALSQAMEDFAGSAGAIRLGRLPGVTP